MQSRRERTQQEDKSNRLLALHRSVSFFGGTILKHVIIAEKPSVANEYAKVLGVTIKARDIMKMINGLLLGR